MRDGRSNNEGNHTSDYYMKDDTSMCEPHEANYVQGYQGGYHDQNSKNSHEFVYTPPSIRNENDKGDVEFIEEDKTQPIPTMPNLNPINSSSPTISPFLKDSTVHIPYTNAKTFVDNILLNHVGDEELSLIDGVRNGVLTKKEIKKDDMGVQGNPNKTWEAE
ncbi:hypothetical protein Tco_1017538 [Tanacetum coccineum]|uniref:Uncharacterized protein n=1 Tax=Tanacetum coccineum TaxID=301880 RepID=A0ABQ5FRR2_9ASTR